MSFITLCNKVAIESCSLNREGSYTTSSVRLNHKWNRVETVLLP